jgi:hypothetical protein
VNIGFLLNGADGQAIENFALTVLVVADLFYIAFDSGYSMSKVVDVGLVDRTGVFQCPKYLGMFVKPRIRFGLPNFDLVKPSGVLI